MTKKPFPVLPIVAALACVMCGQAVQASAADVPKRKAGLWEIDTQMEGRPGAGAMQLCTDASTDNIMRQRAAKAGKNEPQCSTPDVKRQGNTVAIHSVCKMPQTTVTTDAVITGSFDSSYRSDMTVHYDPPMMGMSTAKMTQEAKWLGPCQPGQKPGDIMMPGMGKFNMQDNAQSRKQMEEMMKQRQGQ